MMVASPETSVVTAGQARLIIPADRVTASVSMPFGSSRPAPDTFGTAARTLGIRGPRVNTLDAALLKSWRTTERQRIEFRLEAQNARNHPIFSDPPASYGASNFGLINGTKVGARSVQLGFKYYF